MCLLAVCEPNSTPKRKELECASCNNPHGFGYAIVADGEIITGRGMSAKKIVSEFLSLRKQYPSGYAMFHARYATHGVKNEDNCHPFKVGGSTQTYLAHNGILDVEIHATDKRSDTRVFAEDVLPAMGGVASLDNDNVWKILSKWATGSKIAVLTLDPSAKDVCYIINESSGHWDNNGIWWSNSTYKEDSWSRYIGMPSAVNDDSVSVMDGETECPGCGAFLLEDGNPYYCEHCMTCYDCFGIYEQDCMCYMPERDEHALKVRNAGTYQGYFDFDKEYLQAYEHHNYYK
jgi:glutamine amidotransferase